MGHDVIAGPLTNDQIDRIKDRNVRRNPAVAVSITDPDNPFRYLAIQGQVVEITILIAHTRGR